MSRLPPGSNVGTQLRARRAKAAREARRQEAESGGVLPAARRSRAADAGQLALPSADGWFAAQIGLGDEVIVPAYTFLASASCVLHANAIPIFVDSYRNFILLEWPYIYKGTIRDFYPPVEFLPESPNAFQVYQESLGPLPADELEVLVSQVELYPDEQLAAISRRCGFADALAEVVAAMLLQHAPAREQIYRKGDPGEGMFLIEQGRVELRSDDEVLARLTAGNDFGEMALVTGRPRSSDAVAASDANLWVLFRSDFQRVMSRYPAVQAAKLDPIEAIRYE